MVFHIGTMFGGIPHWIRFRFTQFGKIANKHSGTVLDIVVAHIPVIVDQTNKGMPNHDILECIFRLNIDRRFGQILHGIDRQGEDVNFVCEKKFKKEKNQGILVISAWRGEVELYCIGI